MKYIIIICLNAFCSKLMIYMKITSTVIGEVTSLGNRFNMNCLIKFDKMFSYVTLAFNIYR